MFFSSTKKTYFVQLRAQELTLFFLRGPENFRSPKVHFLDCKKLRILRNLVCNLLVQGQGFLHKLKLFSICSKRLILSMFLTLVLILQRYFYKFKSLLEKSYSIGYTFTILPKINVYFFENLFCSWSHPFN